MESSVSCGNTLHTADHILSLHPLTVALSGGEPTLCPDLFRIIDRMAGKTSLIMDTNGTLALTDRHIDALRRANAAVAELGVYKEDFARQINRYFPKRVCYLFDTFNGFDARDLTEAEVSDDLFADTSSELVMSRMPHPGNVVLCEGYFPETTKDINAQFIFVSLDPDLTKPIVAGLKWFWPRMVPGGVILVHDYFLDAYPHVREAVRFFIEESGEKIQLYPIGDGITAAVCKP